MAPFAKDSGEFDLDGWLEEAKAMIGDNYSPLTMDDTVVILEGERELPDDEDEEEEEDGGTNYDLGVLGASSGTNGHEELDGPPRYKVVERALALDFTNYCTDFVDCYNGVEKFEGMGTGTEKTCLEACGGYPNGDCCVGDSTNPDACGSATAKICKDGSCSGLFACWNVGGSQFGGSAGYAGGIVNSCKGTRACIAAGAGTSGTGSVGVIKVSKLPIKICRSVVGYCI